MDHPLPFDEYVSGGRHAWLYGGAHSIAEALGATWGRSDDGKLGVVIIQRLNGG